MHKVSTGSVTPSRLLLALSWAFVFPWTVSAQGEDERYPFATPITDPLESVTRFSLFSTDRTGDGRQTDALAQLGGSIGVWLLEDAAGQVEVAGAVHGRVASRFSLAGPDQHLLNIDYRAGLLLRIRVGTAAFRADLYHASSHLGDETLVATGRAPISTSREGLDLLVQAEVLPATLLYAGPGVILRSTQSFGHWSGRAGAQWTARPNMPLRPFASIEAFAWDPAGWRVSVTAQAGLALGTASRLGAFVGMGASQAEQFHLDDETTFGVALSYGHP